jgi:hypothetical protein
MYVLDAVMSARCPELSFEKAPNLILYLVDLFSLRLGKEKEVLAMERGGNAKVNAVFEARLPPGSNIKPTNHADGPTRERFIRDKYERRKYFDLSGLSNAPTEDFADSETAAAGAAVGPPSDAAKQRLEQRRARINKSSSTVATGPTMATLPPKTRTKVAQAPASAPPPSVDLLDLMGGFDSAPAAEPPKAPNTTESPAAGLDLFDFSSAAVPESSTSRSNQDANNQWNELTQMPLSQAPPQRPKPALDLSSLYNGAHQQQHPMGFANFPSGGNTYVGNPMPNQMMMNNGMTNTNMQQMTNAMQNMNFSSMTPQHVAYQQQQMMMMQQQQQQMRMMMMSQAPTGGMMPPQSHFSNMNGHNYGASSFLTPASPTPPSSHGMKAAAPAAPEKEDPFAQFGTNMFRSY